MRRYFIFGVVGLALFLRSVNASAIAVAFPRVVEHYQTSLVLTGWVLSIYNLVAVAVIPIMSRLSDDFGRRSTFMLCMLLFTIASFLSAIAPNMGWLILFRALQGAGGGGLISACTGIVSDTFPDMRQRYVGLLSSIVPAGSVVGPNIGALLVDSLGWQSIFWTNVPLGLVILLLIWVLGQPDRKVPGSRNIDFVGTGLIAGTVAALMVSLTMMDSNYHVSWVMITGIFGAGIVCVVMLVRHVKTNPDAALNMSLFARRPFLCANIYNTIFGASVQGISALLPLYAVTVYGMSAFESGLILTPKSITMILASAITSFSLVRWGYRRPMIAGAMITALSFFLLALEAPGLNLLGLSISPVMVVVVFSALMGFGTGTAAPAANNALIDLMPDQVASITGLRSALRQMGGSLAITVGTLILQSSGSMARGFTILYGIIALMTILSIPLVFGLPAKATEGTPKLTPSL